MSKYQKIILSLCPALFAACTATAADPRALDDGSAAHGKLDHAIPNSSHCTAPPAGTAGTVQDIYFDPDGAYPWRTCYTLPFDEARAKILAGDFEGHTQLLLDDNYVTGDSVFVKNRHLSGYSEFQQCEFDRGDDCALDCVITFQDTHQPATAGARYVDRHEYCESRDPEYDVVSCDSGTANAISNTWRQPLSRVQYKLMKHILSQPGDTEAHALSTIGLGFVTDRSESLDSCQDWSTRLFVQFEKNMILEEACDASLEAVIPGDGKWCPWDLQIQRVQCEGYDELVNPRAVTQIPLDLDDPRVQSHCAGATTIRVSAEDTPLDIPDNDPAGVTSTIDVSQEGTVSSLEVDVSITHSYRGDVRLSLVCPSGTEVILQDREGGGADHIRRTFAVSECDGTAVAGSWTLRVSDHAGYDVGALNTWTLAVTTGSGGGGGTISASAEDTPMGIPDNDATGVISTIDVSEGGTLSTVEVEVGITHDYRSDLRLQLVCPSGIEVVLQDREGGSDDNIRRTFSVSECNGSAAAGRWSLRVSDHASYDVGTLDTWGIVATTN